MKICVVPDIHGTEHWKKIKSPEMIAQFEKIVMLGDEFDHWTIGHNRQMSNAQQIMKFKIKNPEKVCLCWSNHAISYYLDERCSGYQYQHAFDIEEFYRQHKRFFDVVYIFDNWIFSHAGVSDEWMRSCGINDLKEINDLFRSRPNFFRWVGPDNFGDNFNEGPLWIRPAALRETAIGSYNQIVGHTENSELPRIFESKQNTKIVCIDSHQHDNLIELDTITGEVNLIP